jgi:hypothetical protein
VKRHHAVCANPPQIGGGSSACNVAPASEVDICDVTPDNTIASSKLSLGGGTDCPLTVAVNVTSKIATMRLRAPVGDTVSFELEYRGRALEQAFSRSLLVQVIAIPAMMQRRGRVKQPIEFYCLNVAVHPSNVRYGSVDNLQLISTPTQIE